MAKKWEATSEVTENRRNVKRRLRDMRKFATWKILIVAILVFPVGLTFMRLDNLRMEELRDAVDVADQKGDIPERTHALVELQDFVFGHMNTNTGPFYLRFQYERDAEASLAGTPEYENIYKEASEYCQPKFNYRWSLAFIDCMTSRLEETTGSSSLEGDLMSRLPNTELYRREYRAPLWSPTWSGFTMLVVALLLLVVIIRFIVWLILRISLFFLQKSQKNA